MAFTVHEYYIPVKPVIRISGIWVGIVATEIVAGTCILGTEKEKKGNYKMNNEKKTLQ